MPLMHDDEQIVLIRNASTLQGGKAENMARSNTATLRQCTRRKVQPWIASSCWRRPEWIGISPMSA
jgi:hypothetical protein